MEEIYKLTYLLAENCVPAAISSASAWKIVKRFPRLLDDQSNVNVMASDETKSTCVKNLWEVFLFVGTWYSGNVCNRNMQMLPVIS